MKTRKNSTLCLLMIVFGAVLLLTACQQGVIFYDIEHEVDFEEPTIEGNVYNMVPCNKVLFVQNNSIYSKAWESQKTDGSSWSLDSSAPAGYAVRVASDAGYVYTLIKDEADDSRGKVYAAEVSGGKAGEWNLVKENVIELFDNKVCDADGDTTGRNAYCTDADKKVFSLAGTVSTEIPAPADITGATDKKLTAAIFDGTADRFSSSTAITTFVTGTRTFMYLADNKTVKFREAGEAEWKTCTTTTTAITALAVDSRAGILFVGTEYEGLRQAALFGDGDEKAGETKASLSEAATNAGPAFDTRYIFGVWPYGKADTCYVAAASREHSSYNKLWGYYKDRGNWNYE